LSTVNNVYYGALDVNIIAQVGEKRQNKRE